MLRSAQGIPESDKISLFAQLGCDVQIIKVVLLLTGALHGTKNQVVEYLSTFRKYDWLWKDDKETAYNIFIARSPSIQDFAAELQKFMAVEKEIEAIPPMHNIGALSLNTANLKLQLRNESRQWKVQYSNKVHQQARDSMYAIFEYVRVTTSKLHIKIDGLDDLRRVMDVLREIREVSESEGACVWRRKATNLFTTHVFIFQIFLCIQCAARVFHRDGDQSHSRYVPDARELPPRRSC